MEHVRIDEGVKRGPAQHQQAPIGQRLEGDSWTIPQGLDPDYVLERYLVEQRTSGIAKELGIRRAALTGWLLRVRPQQWKEVLKIRALCTKEEGQEEIYDATSALRLARARELLRSAQWDLERLDPENYAQKQEVTLVDQRDLGDKLRRANERVIEGESTPVPELQLTADCNTPE